MSSWLKYCYRMLIKCTLESRSRHKGPQRDLKEIIRSVEMNSECDKPMRVLGELEKFHYYWNIRCGDNFPMKVTLSCKYPVTTKHVTDAISVLVKQHPPLRMMFVERNNVLGFVISDEIREYIEVLPRNEFDIVFQSFSLGNKVWRFVMLQDDNELNTLTFLLAFHHSLTDYRFNREIIKAFVENLNLIQLGKTPPVNDVYNLSGPIETLIENEVVSKISQQIKTCTNESPISFIDAFKRSVDSQDNLKSAENSSRTIRMKLDVNLTKTIKTSKALCKGSLSSLILAICVRSLMNILKKTMKQNEAVEIPFCFMVDLRRYLKIKTEFIGDASVDMVCSIIMDPGENSNETFWKVANNISDKMSEILRSGEAIRKLNEGADDFFAEFESSGEKHYKEAIFFTHAGNVDNIIGENRDIKLADIQVNTNAHSDFASVFYVLTNLFQDEMHFCIVYDSNFTPDKTAQAFVEGIEQIIQNMLVKPT